MATIYGSGRIGASDSTVRANPRPLDMTGVLFTDTNIAKFALKKDAQAFAKQFGWKQSDVILAKSRFSEFYIVAAMHGTDILDVLQRDGSVYRFAYDADRLSTSYSARPNPTYPLHAFHIGHTRDGAPLYVVADSRPGHRHDEYARMPSGRRAVIVQHRDRYEVSVSAPGVFETEHQAVKPSLKDAVAFAKRYG